MATQFQFLNPVVITKHRIYLITNNEKLPIVRNYELTRFVRKGALYGDWGTQGRAIANKYSL